MNAPTLLPERLTTYGLADLAGCAIPDRGDDIGRDYATTDGGDPSPGALFLRRVEDDYREAVEAAGDVADVDPDRFGEIAYSAVPTYTHERWQVFADLAAYEEDASELGADASDLTEAAGVALYMIAERLCHTLHREAEEHTVEEFPDPARCDACGLLTISHLDEHRGCPEDPDDHDHDWSTLTPSEYLTALAEAKEAAAMTGAERVLATAGAVVLFRDGGAWFARAAGATGQAPTPETALAALVDALTPDGGEEVAP